MGQAISNVCPNATWGLDEPFEYENLAWRDEAHEKPSKEVVMAEYERLLDAEQRTEYQRQRAAEYPPMADYLDAVVKGDQAQMQAYIDACLAVKAKYPKEQA
jgi:hypothetical protein